MERHIGQALRYCDNNDLAKMSDLILDKDFIDAVDVLEQATAEQVCELAEAFAVIAEKHGMTIEAMQASIEMMKSKSEA